MNLSAEAYEALFGDEMVLKMLDICKTSFESGNKSALLEVLEICARYQAVIPEWASDTILQIRSQLENGKAASFNDVFGYEAINRNTAKKRNRIRENYEEIKNELFHYRCNGGSFNAEEAFDTIATKIGVSRRTVEAVYKENPFLKKIPQASSPHTVIGYAHSIIPLPRRRGRGILKDNN